jgi:signal transduction histidine kinase/CheY-like chemotaxis protein
LRSIRQYLFVLVVAATFPGALLAGVLVWRAITTNRAVAERRLVESARVDARAIDRQFESTMGTLQALATSPTLDRDDLEAFHDEARRVQATQPGWYTILLLSLDGRQIVSSRVPWGGQLLPVAEPDSLMRVINSKQPTVGAVRPAPLGGAEHRFAIRVPVTRQGTLKSVLSAVIDVESLATIVPRQVPESDEFTRTILDPEGTIAVRTRGAEHFIGSRADERFRARISSAPETISRETTREGLPVYAASSRGQHRWTAVVVVPRSVLDAPLSASLAGMVTGGIVLILSGMVAVILVSRRLSGDIEAATLAAEAVAEGRELAPSTSHVIETRRLQRSLSMAAALLEQRARERDEQIRRADAARSEAEDANRTKDQFLAVLGHELRNPLAPALTALELMKARNPDEFKREREVLERQVAHMARLVNDLLDVSRLARGKVQLQRQRFELREAADRAVDMARPVLLQNGHMLTVSIPDAGLPLDADLDRIVQVLANLLTNAARYTPAGGRVTLTASASDGRAAIVCEDSGPGVPPELLPDLFKPFAQGPRALDRREGGLGLGLALARIFTELHGGTIEVENRSPESGARFLVTLPLGASAPIPAAAAPSRPSIIRQRILVVDDNRDACEMLRLALEDVGHDLAIADDGPAAIDIAARFRPHVAIVDIGLPGMTGYELARRLRATDSELRLIALTGYGQAGDVDAAHAAGFDAHCTKPIALAALLDCINTVTPT